MVANDCEGLRVSRVEYERLVRAVTFIAGHPPFPGKGEAVKECVGDILHRSRCGRLSSVQRAELLGILLAPGVRGAGPDG